MDRDELMAMVNVYNYSCYRAVYSCYEDFDWLIAHRWSMSDMDRDELMAMVNHKMSTITNVMELLISCLPTGGIVVK